MHQVQIAFSTDMSYFRPSLVAMTSIVDGCTRPVTVHFLGDRLTEAAQRELRAACAAWPGTELVFRNITDMLQGAPSSGHYSRSTMGRMLLPEFVSGRLLYVDADTIAYGDVSPLFDLDMGGMPVAAVRDFDLLTAVRRDKAFGRERRANAAKLLEPHPFHDAFNAGILLMDCDAVKSGPGYMDRMKDFDAAAGFDFLDQDLLNLIFKGRVAFLDPCWNSFWGRTRHMHRVAQAMLPEDRIHAPAPPKIVHFTGPRKPWSGIGMRRALKPSFWSMYGIATIRYRRAAKRLMGRVGAAVPEAGAGANG